MRNLVWKLGVALLGVALTGEPLRAQGDLINDVRIQLSRGGFSGAEAEVRNYKAQAGPTPEYLEALSWMARGAAENAQWNQASTYATETRTLAEQQLAKRKL